jgi:hypothetical protein
MSKYRRKLGMIEAVQFTGDADNVHEISKLIQRGIKVDYRGYVPMLSLGMEVFGEIGDYVVKDADGNVGIEDGKTFEKYWEKAIEGRWIDDGVITAQYIDGMMIAL